MPLESTTADTNPQDVIRRARLWPFALILLGQIVALVITVTPTIDNASRFIVMMAGPLICAVLSLIWLLFASRLPWLERLFTLLIASAVPAATTPLIGHNMGVIAWIYGVPLTLFVIFTVNWLMRTVTTRRRAPILAASLVLIWGSLLACRLDGFDGAYYPEFAWRWSLDKESHERFQSLRGSGGAEADAASSDLEMDWSQVDPAWPGFRGPTANSIAQEVSQQLDWSKTPPQERWRIPMGPAWSSFAYAADRLLTQEQRQEHELVTCYDAKTGDLIWEHAVGNRFEEVVSGPGPRATPTFSQGRVFSYGAKGILCALSASDGEELWRRDVMKDFNAPLPMWGFSCSPLAIDNIVIVYAGGEGSHGLCAFNVDTGESVWQVESRGMNYSSAELAKLGEEQLILFADGGGLNAIDPKTGEKVWQYKPTKWEGPAMVQPQQIDGDSVILPLGDGVGLARLKVEKVEGQWKVTESWTSRKLRPSFNDFVFHKGYLYGFDQHIVACVDAKSGERSWKRGRYGFGQILLFPQFDQLLILAEKGDAVLLAADPQRHRELGRFPALQGKTWNHPVVVHDSLFVRNAEEAVCFDLGRKPANLANIIRR